MTRRIFITGICGFVGSTLAKGLVAQDREVFGIDNFCRAGSYLNKAPLQKTGITVFSGDLRNSSDLSMLPKADWVIDAAANPSVLAGLDGKSSSRQLVEHNLLATVNILEYCKKNQAGFILLSTSRVYSIKEMLKMKVEEVNHCFSPLENQSFTSGLSIQGVKENFPTDPPISLYGSTKLASETLALEYGNAFSFPVWINRCGVMAGAGQFGKPDQGIFSYWLNSHLRKRPLKYLGFAGTGYQARDVFHPLDLIPVLKKQFIANSATSQICNFGGARDNLRSLKQLSLWCEKRWGYHQVTSDLQTRPYDIPWMAMDIALAQELWDFKIEIPVETILTEIAEHAEANPQWLDLSE